MKDFEMYECFCWFSHLKYDFDDQKLTSQKWCLEVHRTFSNDSRDKKRFSMGWTTQNDLFFMKRQIFCRKSVTKTQF